MEVPKGIKILTMISNESRKDKGAYFWRACSRKCIQNNGKWSSSSEHIRQVGDVDGDETYIYGVVAWPFETGKDVERDDDNWVPKMSFASDALKKFNPTVRVPGKIPGDYVNRAKENALEIMTSAAIPKLNNQQIQMPMKFFSRWNDVKNYINSKEYMELFDRNEYFQKKLQEHFPGIYGGGRRTRRRRRKKRTRRRGKRGAVRTKHNTPKAFDLKTMKVIPNPHYKKPKKPSPITLNVQGQQVPFSSQEVAKQRKMLTQLKKLSPASSSKAFQLGSFNPQTNKGGRRKKSTKRRGKSRRRMRRKRKRKTRRKRKR